MDAQFPLPPPLAQPNFLSSALGMMAGHFGPVVLMYHSIVTDTGATERFSVSLERFRDQIHYLVSEGWTFLRLCDLGSGQPSRSKQVVITFDDAYANTLPACDVLVRAGVPGSWFVVSSAMSGLTTWTDADASPRPTLRPHELRDMVGSGMEIGGHSRTHRRLARIHPAELDSEVAQCKQEIEDAIGKSISSFCYPYGDHSAEVVKAVEQAGYERACTTDNGTALADQDPFRIRRIEISGEDNISEFARKLFLLNDDAGLRGLMRSTRRLVRN